MRTSRQRIAPSSPGRTRRSHRRRVASTRVGKSLAASIATARAARGPRQTAKTDRRKPAPKHQKIASRRSAIDRAQASPAHKRRKETACGPAGEDDRRSSVRAELPRRVRASARARARKPTKACFEKVANGAEIPVENAAALVPFFEQLYRHQNGEMPGPLRILHYGDSHTAADEWTGDLRARFQEKFGDGGSGYSLAGRPWNGYRRLDVRSGSTRGWHTDGLVGRTGDGIYGLGGVSMSTSPRANPCTCSPTASSSSCSISSSPAAARFRFTITATRSSASRPTANRLPATITTKPSPARTSWKRRRWITRRCVCSDGSRKSPPASPMKRWASTARRRPSCSTGTRPVLRSNIERRNPALIVLAYGTNEAGRKDWTLEAYRDMFAQLIERVRAAAPTATILVIGPPDRDFARARAGADGQHRHDRGGAARGRRRPPDARSGTCAPRWAAKAPCEQWVQAGMAQGDHVHFTGPGYHMLGDAVFRDLMSQYDLFLKARAEIVAAASVVPPTAVKQ